MDSRNGTSIRRLLIASAPALAVYLVLVVWLTWPLARHLGTNLADTAFPCHFDALWTVWALAHESRALATDPSSFLDGNVFHPARHSLFYGPTALAALFPFAPVFLATGNPTLAINVTVLGSIALTAWTLHLATLWWTGSQLAGFVAAWTLLTTREALWAVPCAPQYAVLQYLPLVTVLAAGSLESGRAKVALVCLAVLQCLADVIYLAPIVIAPLALLAVVRVIRRASRPAGWRLIGVVAVSLVMLVPVYAAHIDVFLREPDLAAQSTWRGPTGSPAVPVGSWPVRGPAGVSSVSLVLIAVGLLCRKSGRISEGWRHAGLLAVLSLVLAVPPRIRVDALHSYPLPHAVIAEHLPVYRFLRVQGRLAYGGMIGLALLAGLGFAECARRLSMSRHAYRAPLLAAAAVVAMYVGYESGLDPVHPNKPLPRRYPLMPAVSPEDPVLDLLRTTEGPLLEIPVESLADQATAMYRSIFHRRPVLNGYTSYHPIAFRKLMEEVRELPSEGSLIHLRAAAGVRAILVHRNPRLPNRVAWERAARGGRLDLQLVGRHGKDLLFAIPGRPAHLSDVEASVYPE